MTERTEQGELPRVTVQFNEAETAQIHALAEWFAAVCIKHGEPVPPDPMRALLYAAGMLHTRCAFLESVLVENDINAADYAPPPETMQ